MKRSLSGLLAAVLTAAVFAPLALAQPVPPEFSDRVFIGFLEYSPAVDEPLPSLVRRQYADVPGLWSQIEDYITTYNPLAFTAPRSRILRQGVRLRLPLYGPPAPPLPVRAPIPMPKPEVLLPAKANEPIVGALIAAEPAVEAVGSLGQHRTLGLQDTVFRGDTINTNKDGEARVRLLDGTLVVLRADSAVLIKDFSFAKSDVNAGVLNLKLLRGAMRTLSGLIPKDPKSVFALETPSSTIKVRGTDYAVRWCDGACMLNGAPADNGLYAGVLEGGIDLAGASATAVAGDIVKVKTPGAEPIPAPEAASLVFMPDELLLLPKKQPCTRNINQKHSQIACNAQ
jgi:hypothetical protein